MADSEPTLLGSSEVVARCAIFPQFSKEGEPGSFAFEKLFYFREPKAKTTPKTWLLSVGWRAKLPTEGDVHAYGCRTAANSNQRRAEEAQKKGQAIVPLEDTVHYVGYYEFPVSAAAGAANDVYEVYAENSPEMGEDAHCHVVFREKTDLPKDPPKSARRTKIVDAIWRRSSGPRKHICAADEAHRAFLEAIPLEEPPNAENPTGVDAPVTANDEQTAHRQKA
ncbi:MULTISPECIES: hypothetical protein [unclassified Mesorhizobium]|uniref:hypothetical protein n=1 Tax=unclassified Mesorhizobium TaxID=325217 RepID=UPI000FCAF200|nr:MULTISPECIES: hypothetical protein [unclassified Mesorhizobium]RUV02373.1 hypothetical protein EOA79_17625 [Mesorhizobium sp. M1A.F.Ca.IN.020.03.2.1]RUV88907.1 hypothetical protein EOA51_06195 [Mesorhizobium sp. M1A.F.Ca.IN.020.32.1.1]RUV94588.1 hypothetical protein EOA49_28805 [Mesorhizobium sp. M1A.F.Ca.IN.020.04.1.1]RUW05035.1 hypothetical protein EOA53_26850 [Mesorhizobium sp. M1A.F.Ca.IN.020.03.1.1]RUW06006.1 hypothetical protein EOA46_27085 [Mesorhizobium sp. M1A.F.Ca.IN.022.05.2.1]